MALQIKVDRADGMNESSQSTSATAFLLQELQFIRKTTVVDVGANPINNPLFPTSEDGRVSCYRVWTAAVRLCGSWKDQGTRHLWHYCTRRHHW